MDIKKLVGSNLKKLRQNKNLTQKQLGNLVNLRVQSVSAIECGENFITAENLNKFCEIFECSPQQFFYTDLTDSNQNNQVITEINNLLTNIDLKTLKRIYNIVKILY